MADSNAPKSYGWVKPVALYGGTGLAIGLVGYGVYSLINSWGTGPGIDACESNWQTAYSGYYTQWLAYYNQNGQQPLTKEQNDSLQVFVDQMNAAEQCIQKIQNASTEAFWTTLTEIAVAVVVGGTLYGFFKAYINRTGGSGVLQSGAEARNAIRNAQVQADANDGTISPSEAASNVEANNSAVQAEAPTESTALNDTAESQLAQAEEAGDEDIVLQIQDFVETVVDDVSYYATVCYDYFIALF